MGCVIVGVAVSVAVSVAVAVGVSVSIGVPSTFTGNAVSVGSCWGGWVGNGGTTDCGSTPCGMMSTPGVPFWGGVMIICSSATVSGVGVKVGKSVRVGTGVGAGCGTKVKPLQPSTAATSANNTVKSASVRCLPSIASIVCTEGLQ